MFIKNVIEFFPFLRVQRYIFFAYGACWEDFFSITVYPLIVVGEGFMGDFEEPRGELVPFLEEV